MVDMSDEKLVIKPKRAKGDDGHKTFSIRIKDETVEKLDSVVSQTGYSRNELIAMCIDFAIDRIEIDGK